MSTSVNAWLTPLITGLFTLLGVWLGNTLSQRNSFKQAHRQKMRDLRISSYAKVMGLKLSFAQAVRTVTEAKILCEYYDSRFHLSAYQPDREFSIKQNERMLGLIPEVSKLRREISEVLGEIRISFPTSNALDESIKKVYEISPLDVPELKGTFKSLEELEAWKTANVAALNELIRKEYQAKIQTLLDFIYPLIEKTGE